VLGAIGGAVIGDQVERDGNRGPAGWRVVIRLDGGGDQALQLANPGDLRVGARVRFVNGQLQRVG
jgi:outer membrane lipoprotein SlyB